MEDESHGDTEEVHRRAARAGATATTSRYGTAARPSTPPLVTRSGTGCRGRGTWQINRVENIMATVELMNPTEGRAYYDRRDCEGKTSMEAVRALKRRLSNIVYDTMLDDAMSQAANGARRAREGNAATTLTPPRPAHMPHRPFGQASSRTRQEQA